MAGATKSSAIVTGANKGIGLEICRQLALKGVMVVLTARSEKRGPEAVEKLESGLSELVIFHQLEVTDPASIASLAEFIKTQFGKLDILVNNVGILGTIATDTEAMAAIGKGGAKVKLNEILTQTWGQLKRLFAYELLWSKKNGRGICPSLRLSDSPRIVNVSSSMGKLKNIPSEWASRVLDDAENLTEDRVDKVLAQFLKDFKDGALRTKGWPPAATAYIVLKAAIDPYTRIVAKKYPSFCINCVCPGYVKTDLNYNNGVLTVKEGAEGLVMLALLPSGGSPSGLFFSRKEVSPF